MYLVIDIGGTFMRLALSEDGKTFINDPQKLKCDRYSSLQDALLNFVQAEKKSPQDIKTISIARSGRNAWEIDNTSITRNFPSACLSVVNDFEANALGLINAAPDDVVHLGGMKMVPDTTLPRAVIGSGTGLGLAYIANGIVHRTHGGHMLPALTTAEQISLFGELQKLKTDKTIPIYEDALSGNGLLNIYKILSGRNHLDCEYSDTHHLLAEGRNNPLVQQSLKFYHEILGQFAHQVLAFGGAYGGLFLTGGITDRLISHDLFDKEAFLEALYQETVPVVLDDVRKTPIFWVKDEFISLGGLLSR